MKRHIQGAFEELDLGYDVSVESVFEVGCVRIVVVVGGEVRRGWVVWVFCLLVCLAGLFGWGVVGGQVF
jgi:hypothetical protein